VNLGEPATALAGAPVANSFVLICQSLLEVAESGNATAPRVVRR
jgi:hypothetical protein